MIYLYEEFRAELLGIAREEAPLEAVGLISAPKTAQAGEIPSYQLWRAENASESPEDSFLIAAAEQTALLHSIWQDGEDLVGLFHSHPRSGDPTPSARDRAIASSHVKPLTWVICALADGEGKFWVGQLP